MVEMRAMMNQSPQSFEGCIAMIRKVLALGLTTLTVAVAGILVFGSPASAHPAQFRATLRDPSGRVVGTVKFHIGRHVMSVNAKLRPNRYVEASQFHGFHIHANNDPANGDGCVADPEGPNTWFVSADGTCPRPGRPTAPTTATCRAHWSWRTEPPDCDSVPTESNRG